MVALIAIFLIVAIILMLVLLEKGTGGKEGGIGCVSGTILFGILLLVMNRSQELKNQGRTNPISSLEGFLNSLPGLLAWLLGAILTLCIVAGFGFLVFRMAQRESDRKSERDYWMNLLTTLEGDSFDSMSSAYRNKINAAFRSDDWIELRRRRSGVSSCPIPDQPTGRDWGPLTDLARFTPLILMALALLWQIGSGIIRRIQKADQLDSKPSQVRRLSDMPNDQPVGRVDGTSAGDRKLDFEDSRRPNGEPPAGLNKPAGDWMRRFDNY